MKTLLEKENIQLILSTLGVLVMLLFLSNGAKAAIKTIHCETNFGLKSFTIENDTIAFETEVKGRAISSVHQSKTLPTSEGITKTLYVDGNKHFIKIKNLNKPNDLNDFMAITTPEGHKMTYPLSCDIH